ATKYLSDETFAAGAALQVEMRYLLQPSETLTVPVIFCFISTVTTIVYTLSLHDALPIYRPPLRSRSAGRARLRGGGRTNPRRRTDRKSTRLNSSHVSISYAVFCLKKKKNMAFLTKSRISDYILEDSLGHNLSCLTDWPRP